MKENNRFSRLVATSRLKNLFRPDTKIVWIPNAYFDGYFPQLPRKNQTTSHKLFGWKDQFVYDFVSSGNSTDIEKFLDKVCDENFIPHDEIQRRIDESFQKLRDREWFCDVKISDYIEKNYRDKQIFFLPNHPFPMVLVEFTKRIMRFLGFESDNFLQLHELLDENDRRFSLCIWNVPIYPAVKKFFNFQECVEVYYPNQMLTNFHGGFREYMREYVLQILQEQNTR